MLRHYRFCFIRHTEKHVHTCWLSCSAEQAHMEPAPWLAFEGMWGSSVVAPALQDWFYRAEHPVSRSWLEQVRWLLRGRCL